MSSGDGLRLLMIVIGVVILGFTIMSLAKKHMTESFCIVWGIASVVIICGGIILQPTEWSKYISWGGLMLILFGAVFLLSGAFYFSVRISRLTREIRELAIQVSLLNQENAMILAELTGGSGTGKAEYNEKTLIRH